MFNTLQVVFIKYSQKYINLIIWLVKFQKDFII